MTGTSNLPTDTAFDEPVCNLTMEQALARIADYRDLDPTLEIDLSVIYR